MFKLLIALCIVVIGVAFTPAHLKFGQSAAVSRTKVYEDFNLDFKNPQIISDKQIFSEKQLREFTATYSVDERGSLFDFIGGLFKKDDTPAKESVLSGGNEISDSLKKTVSLSVLEEKTEQFVTGKINAKTFSGVLKAAFGDNLSKVLPSIVSSLPSGKADELSKVTK